MKGLAIDEKLALDELEFDNPACAHFTSTHLYHVNSSLEREDRAMDLPTFDEIFKAINVIFWVLGIPLDNSRLPPRFYFACLILSITVIGEIAFFATKISSENILELTHLTPCLCFGAISFLKAMFLAGKHEKISQLKACLRELYEIITGSEGNRKMIAKEIIRVKSLIKYYFILNGALVSVYNFSTLAFMAYHYVKTGNVKFMLPYAVVFPFEIYSWPVWSVCYVQAIVSGFICITLLTVSDALFCIYTSQVCNNFFILSNEIKRLNSGNHNTLSSFVRKHQYILKLAEDVEDIFTLMNLFNYLVGSLEICALGFSMTIGKWSHVLGYILFLLSVLLQILMMSVFGENIITESRRVGEAASLCEWHEMDHNSKKTILIIMIRSHKHQKLTAYKFSVISYASFTKIISTSWSYFTILRTVYKP